MCQDYQFLQTHGRKQSKTIRWTFWSSRSLKQDCARVSAMFGSTSRVNLVDWYHFKRETWIAVSLSLSEANGLWSSSVKVELGNCQHKVDFTLWAWDSEYLSGQYDFIIYVCDCNLWIYQWKGERRKAIGGINLLRSPLSGRNPRISHRQVETPHHQPKKLFIETLRRRWN